MVEPTLQDFMVDWDVPPTSPIQDCGGQPGTKYMSVGIFIECGSLTGSKASGGRKGRVHQTC